MQTRSKLDRLLGLFSEVHDGEGARALGLMASLFVLMVAYYLLKTVREPLILATGGAEIKSYAAGLQAALLIAFVPAYGWLTRRVDRRGLIIALGGFFFLNLQLFYLAVHAGARFVGVAFFVWVGIFSLSTIAQFWSLANDLYAQKEGERLFPIIAFGATFGSPFGARIAETLFHRGVAPEVMLQLAAGLLALHSLLALRFVRRGAPARAAVAAPAAVESGAGGFTLIARSPYLRLVVLLLVLLNIVNTTGEYLLGKRALAAADAAVKSGAVASKAAFLGGFYGDFFFWVNVIAALLQALVVSRLVKRYGMAGVLLFLPLVAFGTYGAAALGAGFLAWRWMKTAENAGDYSVMNTARAMLWLPTSRAEKYRAKQAVDTFFVRIGDVISTLVVAASVFLHLHTTTLAAINALLALVWIAVAVAVTRRHRRLTLAAAAALTLAIAWPSGARADSGVPAATAVAAGTVDARAEALAELRGPAGPVRFGVVRDGVYRGGQPNVRQLALLRQLGVDTVIDLRHGSARDEIAAAAALGMRVVRFPFYGIFGAKADFLLAAVSAMQTNGRVYVHCHVGRDRTSLVVALYRVVVDGWAPAEAWQKEAIAYGYRDHFWYHAIATSFDAAVRAFFAGR